MVSKREKFFYGIGDLSGNIMFGAISFYLLYFMINVGGLTPLYAGFVFLIARGWDAISDYLMGRISDQTQSRFGKRRIYMLLGAIPFGLVFLLLWVTPTSSLQAVKFVYFLFAYLLFNTVWTIVYVPYNALTANMTDDYDERTTINTVRIVMANVGLLLGAALFALLTDGVESILYQAFGSLETSYFVSGIIFGVIAAGIMLLCALFTKERIDVVSSNPYSFFTTLKQFFKQKAFRFTMMWFLFSLIGFDIVMAVFIFFVNDSLGFSGGEISMLFVAMPLVVAITSAALWDRLSAKYAKHSVYAFAAIFVAVSLILCIFIPAKSFIALTMICVLVGFAMSAIQILPYASIPDFVEIDEHIHGVRREGSYYGIVMLMYKIASGVAIAIVSAILGLAGYVENAPLEFVQPESALIAIRYIIGILPGIIFIASIFFAYRANISREVFNSIKNQLRIRKQNGESN